MEQEGIRAIVKYPDQKPVEKTLKGGYKEISDICQGLIDISTLPDDPSVTLIVNDVSLVNGMRPNIVMPEYRTVLCGPIVICGADLETGESVSLSKEQLEKAESYLRENEVHHMSLEGAYRYCQAIAPLREAEKQLREEQKQEEMQA